MQKELEIRINTFQKDWEEMETPAMSNSEEEEKCLSVFDELQSIIDVAEDTKIDLEHRKRNMLEKLEESKEKETKEREESERDIQRETKK